MSDRSPSCARKSVFQRPAIVPTTPYAIRTADNLLAPQVLAGEACIFDPDERTLSAGDVVAIWYKAQHETLVCRIMRLGMAVMPGTQFPFVMVQGSEIKPAILFETGDLLGFRQVDACAILGLHRFVGKKESAHV